MSRDRPPGHHRTVRRVKFRHETYPPLRDYTRSRAVLMGTWNYRHGPLTPLPAAEHSFKRMANLLTGPLCGWPAAQVTKLRNEQGPGDLHDRLVSEFEQVEDVALFFYVGHGQIDDSNQLCLGLVGSRTEPNRRTTTSLPFSAVRDALVRSPASTKILILDCCFSGLATLREATLAALSESEEVTDLAGGTGAYTMAASGAYTPAWFETGSGITRPQTYFTKYFVDIVESGIPGQPARLTLNALFGQLRENMARDGRPVPPPARNIEEASNFIFAHNAAPPRTHVDQAAEIERLRRRIVELELRLQESQIASGQASGPEAHEEPYETETQQHLQAELSQATNELNEVVSLSQGAAYSSDSPLVDPTASGKPTPEAVHHAGPGGEADAASASNDAVPTLPVRFMIRKRGSLTLLCILILAITLPLSLPRKSEQQKRPAPARSLKVSPPKNSPTKPPPNTLSNDVGWVQSISFSPDGKVLAAAGTDKAVQLWDLRTGRTIRKLTGHKAWVTSVAFSPDGKLLASGDQGETIRLWDMSTGQSTRIVSGNTHNHVEAVAFSPDGSAFAAGRSDGAIQLWDVATKRRIQTLQKHTREVDGLVFSPDGKMLATGSYDETVRLWDVRTGKNLRTLTGHTGWVRSLAFSPDGKILASGSQNDKVLLWDVRTGKSVRSFSGPSGTLVAFSPDGRYFASGSYEDPICLWEVRTWRKVKQYKQDTIVYALAFSPDSKTLASGGMEDVIRISSVD